MRTRLHASLVHARTGLTSSTDVLDPKVLAELATRHGVADFSRFRHDFLVGRPGAGGTFRDPSGDYLELLRRLQVIDNAAATSRSGRIVSGSFKN